MAHELENMAYTQSGGVPWHGLGFAVNDNMSVDEILVAADLDWEIEKRRIHLATDDGKIGKTVQGHYALVRMKDMEVFDIVGEPYVPTQNREALSFFKRFVEAGHMSMETAGSLRGGRYIWGLAKIKTSFTLPGGDRVEGYLLVAQPNILGKALIIQFTPIRVVCMNTLSLALGSNLKGAEGSFRMPHTRAFDDDAKKAAELALGLAQEQMDEFEEAATLLSNTRVKEDDAIEYLAQVFKADVNEQGEWDRRIMNVAVDALRTSPGHDLEAAAGTFWGAFNAVTFTVDHRSGKVVDNRVASSWIGEGSRIKKRALELAIDLAKAA